MVLLKETYHQTQDIRLLENIFSSQSQIIEFDVYKDIHLLEKSGPIKALELINTKVLESYGLNRNKYSAIFHKQAPPLKQIKLSKIFIQNSSHHSQLPHLLLGFYNNKSQEIYVSRIVLKDLINVFQNNIYDTYLIDRKGELYIHKDLQKVFKKKNLIEENYLRDIIQSELHKVVKEVTSNIGEKLLVASSKVERLNLYVISEIKKDKAFTAASYLINKSLFFGLFIIAISMIIAIVYSRSFTSPIEQLFMATQRIAEGDFSTEVSVKSKDEIGALADSFNYMGREIVRYMEEMREKARIENELAVAQLVQSAFFPEDHASLQGIDLAAFYTPATECGGDWWGHLEDGDKTIFFVADATGHGVPAALLTATTHCCLMNLKHISKIDKNILNSPSQILQFMNKAIASIGQEVLVTCFVAIVYTKEKVVKYSNASHNPPFLYRKGERPPSKQEFHPLMGGMGPRLGHQMDGEFPEELTDISAGDALIFYTDGIVECHNSEGKSWGSRKFMKTLVENIEFTSIEARDKIINELKLFQGDQPAADDMTLVITKII